MKKILLLSVICITFFFTACQSTPQSESEGLSENVYETLPESNIVLESEEGTQNEIYTISGKDRNEEDYIIKDGKLIFPRGTVTQVIGSTTGTQERNFLLSENEIGEIISIIERDSIAIGETDVIEASEMFPADIDWEEGWGILYITIKTASEKENGIYLYFGMSDFVFGGFTYSSGMSFDVDSSELAQKLRDIVEYKTVDLEILDRAISATCTSVFNGNSLTFTGDELRQLVNGVQRADRVLATKRAEAISVEFLLDDEEVIHALFTGTGYNTIGIEAELYEMAEEDVRPFFEAFKENGITLFANEEVSPVVK